MDLPNDVMFRILLHLPAKSLIRFKCVCKSWLDLLQDQSFILAHTKNTASITRFDYTHLLICCRDNTTNERVVSMSSDSSLRRFINQDLHPCFRSTFGHVRLIGPCNGIVCLYGYPDNIALYNPAIGQFKILPDSLIPRPPDARVRGGDLGIGFDSCKNEHKVIQILFCVSDNRGLEYIVEIYSLRTDSWRKYDAIMPANIMYTNIWSAVYRNDIFCWWAKNGDVEVILSFNMCTETFKETPFPSHIEDLGGNHRITRAILPFDDSIAVVVYHVKEMNKTFDIWVLRGLGEGEKESWSKLSSIGPVAGVERPLAFWKNGEIILENSCRELVLYNPEREEMENLGLYGKRDRLEALVYKGSLVPLQHH